MQQTHPFRTLLSGQNLRHFGVAFVTSTCAWLFLDGTIGVFTGNFKKLGNELTTVNLTVLLAAVVGVAIFPLVGAARRRFGRRHVMLALALFNLVVGTIAFGLATSDYTSSVTVVVAAAIAIVGWLAVFAMITAYIMEMFPTEVRSSGYGIAYSLPSVIPAFYPYYMLWIGGAMNGDYTPLVILVAGGVFLLAASYISKDLRHVRSLRPGASPRALRRRTLPARIVYELRHCGAHLSRV